LNLSKDLGNSLVPFSTDPQGTVLTEGASLLMIEEYEHAKARGARIYAEICGFSSVGMATTEGIAHAIRGAVGSSHVDLIISGAKGSEQDLFELEAIDQTIGGSCDITNTKGQTGHGVFLGGSLESVFAV
jgi:3-oxoacyl-[acyl-carrier-protein] synthase II